jgi:starvation-inducible outer membrane lipoprotein
MKTSIPILLLLLSGCVSVPQEQSERMRVASQRYATVTTGMIMEQMVAVLGVPQRETGGTAVWEVRYGKMNFESLTVDFDPEGRSTRIMRVHRRDSWGPFGSIERSDQYAQ